MQTSTDLQVSTTEEVIYDAGQRTAIVPGGESARFSRLVVEARKGGQSFALSHEATGGDFASVNLSMHLAQASPGARFASLLRLHLIEFALALRFPRFHGHDAASLTKPKTRPFQRKEDPTQGSSEEVL